MLTDIRMPGASGLEVLREARRRWPAPAMVMMTGYANVADAVAGMRQGAFDYVAKPLDAAELALVVARAVEHRQEQEPAGPHVVSPVPVDGGEEQRTDEAHSYRRAVEEARDQASRRYLERLMEAFRGNVTQAAKRAGMTRESLHRVLRKYGVQSDRFSGPPARSRLRRPTSGRLWPSPPPTGVGAGARGHPARGRPASARCSPAGIASHLGVCRTLRDSRRPRPGLDSTVGRGRSAPRGPGERSTYRRAAHYSTSAAGCGRLRPWRRAGSVSDPDRER